MRGNRTKVSIFGAILIALILYASISVSAALVNIDGGSMNTECWGGTSQIADGSVNSPTVPVDPGDTIFINVSVDASDYTVSGDGSTHYFKLTVEYLGVERWNDWEIQIDPMNNAGHTLSVWYKNVIGNETYSTTLFCSVTDDDSPFGYDDWTDYGTVTLT